MQIQRNCFAGLNEEGWSRRIAVAAALMSLCLGGCHQHSHPVASEAPVIRAFYAVPSEVLPGRSAQLKWQVDDADEVVVEPGLSAGKDDSLGVVPKRTTVYRLLASSAKGKAHATATVVVGVRELQYASLENADLGIGASLNGAIPFPVDNPWNKEVSADPVDSNSAAIIASIGDAKGLHPDFGAGFYKGGPIGIPYVVVSSAQKPVPVKYTMYDTESDAGPHPVPPFAPIEGVLEASTREGDRHVLVVDRDNHRLVELYRALPMADGSWSAEGGAVFAVDSNAVRPTAKPGWTSADAAGLPIFPGLVRYDEVQSGVIAHALRFTVSHSRRAYVPPATHWASRSTAPNLPPMGMRVRLKASYVIPPEFSRETKVILTALKKYGMFMADNGSDWFLSGAPDERWNNKVLREELGSVRGEHFEVIRMDGLVTP
jgi:hypothetical protein